TRTWLRLRGEILPEPEREEITSRLEPRHAVRRPDERASRRFEAPAPASGPVPIADATRPAEPATPAAEQPKPAEADTGDGFSRLAKAKKKIMDERKKDL